MSKSFWEEDVKLYGNPFRTVMETWYDDKNFLSRSRSYEVELFSAIRNKEQSSGWISITDSESSAGSSGIKKES